MASINIGSPINKKTALDQIIRGKAIEGKALNNCASEFTRTLNIVKKVYFPALRSTRFANSADFYSLFMFTWEMDKAKFILSDLKRNKQAQTLLIWLSNGVDLVRKKIAQAEGTTVDQQMFANYLFTTGDSDSSATRNRRTDILRQLLGGLFEKKDERRGFTPGAATTYMEFG